MNATKILTKNTLILIGLMIALSACSTRSIDAPPPTPVPSLQLPAPTPTLPSTQVAPSPTAVPTQAPAPTDLPAPTSTQAPAPAQPPEPTSVVVYPTPVVNVPCTYRATFLGDMTIPDNSVIAAGAAFVKTWRLRNDGTCAWGSNGHALRTLVFVNGDRLGAPDAIALPGDVLPGGTVDLSVQMIAPSTAGTYRSEWLLWVDGGNRIGVGYTGSTPLSAQIVVASTTDSGDGNCTDQAAYVGDVTIPDNTVIAPGTAFVKTWRLKNTGSCTWNSNYLVVHLSGTIMTQQPGYWIVQRGQSVQPGQIVDISVGMTAPIKNGNYTAYWGLKGRNGQLMPIQGGANGNSVYVIINVNDGSLPPGNITGTSIDIELEQGSGSPCTASATYLVHAYITADGPTTANYEIESTAGQIPAGNFTDGYLSPVSPVEYGMVVFDQADTKTINYRFVGPYPYPNDITILLRVNGGEWHNTKLSCQ